MYMELEAVRNRYMSELEWVAERDAVAVYNLCMFSGAEEPHAQIDRILESDTFHSSVVLRRLLRFLADKTLSGEADQLNEYSIGVDALGKPRGYDPRQDAIVRLHIGRIRQKLGDYYRNEGKDDRLILELPKGRFKLKWEMRSTTPAEPPKVEPQNSRGSRRKTVLALAGGLLLALIWGTLSTVLWWRARQNQTASGIWTPELAQLWQPFIASKRPLVIAIADPLIVGFQGTDVFLRKISLRRPEDAARSPEVAALRKVLGEPAVQSAFNFTPSGEVMSSFLLGRLLGTRKQDISLARGGQVLLRGLAANDVILIGPEIMFEQKLSGVQLQPELTPAPGGIRNLRPRAGEPAFYADSTPGAAPDDGEVYALISRAPGPLGGTNFESFTSSRTWGRQGAIQAFTDPALAKVLYERIKTQSGAVSRYFQIVLKIKFREGVSVNISYVTHRVIASTM